MRRVIACAVRSDPADAAFLRSTASPSASAASRRSTASRSTSPRGEFVMLPRAVRLRQDDAAAHHRRASRRRRRARIVQDGRDISRLPRDQARLRHRVPVVRAVPEPHDRRQRRLRPRQPARRRARRSRARVDELLKLVGLPDAGAKYPGAALRRPAAAHRARARARDVARPAAARRAAVGARCARARAAARRDPRAAAAPRRDDDHGDARPGRGAVDGRPHRRDEPRRASSRSARRSRSTASRRRRSSPTSSARSTCSPAVAAGRRARPRRRRAADRRAGATAATPARDVKLYLRPEDVLVNGRSRRATPNVCAGAGRRRSSSSARSASSRVDARRRSPTQPLRRQPVAAQPRPAWRSRSAPRCRCGLPPRAHARSARLDAARA